MKIFKTIAAVGGCLLLTAALTAGAYWLQVTADAKLQPALLEKASQAACVLDGNGEEIADISLRSAARSVRLCHIPLCVRRAFLAAEDRKFYSHHGLDYAGMARAAYKNLRARAFVQGASTISQQLDSAGWHSADEYLCIVLQLSYLDQKNLTVHAICSYIENILSGSCAFQFKDDIAVFVDLTLSSMSLTDISARLSCFVRDSLLKAGYSRVLLGHFNLRRQYEQACIALEVGSRRNPSFWIHRFNDIAFDYILEQATRKLPGYMISHERLLKLKYVDEENGTEYMRTLRLYLDNHLNAVQTARDLFVHRSTFLYRLERIRTILGTDFSNPDEVLYLMLSFRFIDREERRMSDQ